MVIVFVLLVVLRRAGRHVVPFLFLLKTPSRSTHAKYTVSHAFVALRCLLSSFLMLVHHPTCDSCVHFSHRTQCFIVVVDYVVHAIVGCVCNVSSDIIVLAFVLSFMYSFTWDKNLKNMAPTLATKMIVFVAMNLSTFWTLVVNIFYIQPPTTASTRFPYVHIFCIQHSTMVSIPRHHVKIY